MTQLRLTDLDQIQQPSADVVLSATSRGEWLSLEEVARRSGRSPGHLRRMCGDRWLSQNKARHIKALGSGVKRVWEIRSIALTELGITENTTLPAIDLRSVTADQRMVALERQQIVQNWMVALEAGRRLGFNSDQSTAQFLHRLHLKTGKEINRSTLYKWRQAFQRQGLAGLVDRRSTTESTPVDDPFLAEVARLWLRLSKPKMTICYEMATLTASDKGWTACSYRSVVRHLNSLDKARVIKLRGGESDYVDLAEPFQERDYSTIESNEIWVADHHPFDVLVRVPGDEKGRVARPWLTAWMDMRSRMIVGYLIRMVDPNTDVILEVFRMAVLRYGVPSCAYTDNGKDFDARVFTGQTKAQRWKARTIKSEIDEKRLDGVYSALSVKHMHAQPYHGQSKCIERWFRTMEERWGVLWPTYCGRSTDEKPENLYDNVKKGKAPSLEDFIASFDQWLATDYHQRVHTGDSMDGLSPVQCFEANLKTKRTAPNELLEVLLQRRIGPVKVTQNGVRYNGLVYGQHAPELHRLLGQSVYLRIDDQNIKEVSVWSDQDKFIAHAPANRRLPANASAEDLREAMREKRQHNKAIAAASDARLRIAEDLPDRMIRAAAHRNKKQQQYQTTVEVDPTPGSPSIKPVRSPIEDQLKNVQRSLATGTHGAHGHSELDLDELLRGPQEPALVPMHYVAPSLEDLLNS